MKPVYAVIVSDLLWCIYSCTMWVSSQSHLAILNVDTMMPKEIPRMCFSNKNP